MESKQARLVVTPDLPMAEIMARWPETTPVFMAYHMTCVGCCMAPFDTLEDALLVFGLPVEPVLDALNNCVDANNTPNEEL